MKQYLDLVKNVLENGTEKGDRTGTGTKSIFGHQMRFDLSEGFPLLTTKKVHFKSIAIELLWFLKGDTNIKFLNDNGVSIWNEWADSNGDLGRIYGYQWRNWGGKIDQIANVIEQIKTNPNSRRLIVSAWNVGDLDKMTLPPCHSNHIQFYVSNGKLSCSMLQRSGDIFLGIPFNIASYSLLTHMIAQVTGLEVGEFIHNINDCHIYSNHIEQCKLQLTRTPTALPTIKLNPNITDIDKFTYNDIELINYVAQPTIKGKVAV